MAEEVAITPAQITELKAVSAEQINEMANQVLETAKSVNNTNTALEDLSASLYELKKAKDVYDKMAPHVKTQMRNLVTRL